MFGQSDIVTVPRPHLFGLNLQSDRAFYYLALILAVLCGGLVLAVRRSRLGRLLRGLSDSPAALEAHGTNTRVIRLYVFCTAAGLAAVGGVLIAGVTQSAGGTPTGPFGYFNSVVLLAVLAFCGTRPILSPAIAGFVFEVMKIYRPFSESWFTNYEGMFFGLAAIAVATVPTMRIAIGQRVAQREGRSPVTSRGAYLEVAHER
jgi:ABC-type branched-subunit amino acid transport system permease subunit